MPHMEGIFINGEKAKFHPEDILDTDASQYTEEIGESVTSYLDEHLTNPTNPPVDTSLSIAGAAADAKKTGDEISQLKSELSVVNDDIDYVSDKTGLARSLNLMFTNGQSINDSNGNLNTRTYASYSDYIGCAGFGSVTLTMPKYTEKQYIGLAFYDSEKAFVSGVRCNFDTNLEANSSEVRTIDIPSTAAYFRTTWYASTETQYSTEYVCTLIKIGTITTEIENARTNSINFTTYANIKARLDASYAITDTEQRATKNIERIEAKSGRINTTGVDVVADFTVVADANYVHYILPCVKGQKFTVTGTTQNNSGKRLYLFTDFDRRGKYRYDSGTTLTDTEITAPNDGYLVINCLVAYAHSVDDGYAYAIRNPLTTLTPNFLGALATKPFGGEFSKGYICMVTDDGAAGLATDTIPFLIEKEVPFTFAVMRDSEVFTDADNAETYTAAVLDAVANRGCALAQHGGIGWDSKTEGWLNTFFDLEKDFWDSIGVEVNAAVIPGHYTTKLIQAVCGGRFGVVRSGYSGVDSATGLPNGSVTNYYEHYTSGARSNLYCLSSYNCSAVTDQENHNAVDYALANKKLLICYFHENSMNADKWTLVSNLVDYAKAQGLTFTTLDKVPYLL